MTNNNSDDAEVEQCPHCGDTRIACRAALLCECCKCGRSWLPLAPSKHDLRAEAEKLAEALEAIKEYISIAIDQISRTGFLGIHAVDITASRGVARKALAAFREKFPVKEEK